jgi:hypothetical protein
MSSKLAQDSMPENATLTIPGDLMARHVAGSLFALLRWWAINDLPHSPEYMTDVMQQLCVRGTLSTVKFGT